MPFSLRQPIPGGQQGKTAPTLSRAKQRSARGTSRFRLRWPKGEQSSSSSGSSRSVRSTTKGEQQDSEPSARPSKIHPARLNEDTEPNDMVSIRIPAAAEVAQGQVAEDQVTTSREASAGQHFVRGESSVRSGVSGTGVEVSVAAAIKPSHPLTLAQKRALEGPAVSQAFQDARKKEAAKRKLSLTLVGLSSLIATAVLLFALLYLRLNKERRPESADNVCMSKACKVYSRWLLESINNSIDPCQDFYGHVCDGWNKKHTRSVREETFAAAFDRMSRFVKSTIIPEVGQNRLQRAARFYRSCDRVLKGERDELPAVKAALRQAGIVWPTMANKPDTLHTLVYVALRLHWSVLLPLVVTQLNHSTEVVFQTPTDLIPIATKYGEISSNTEIKASYVQSLRDAFGSKYNGSTETLTETEEFLKHEEYAINRLYEGYATSSTPELVNDSVIYNTVPGVTKERWKSVLQSFAISITEPVNFRTELTSYVSAFFHIWTQIGDTSMHVLVSWMTVQLAALYANRRLILNFFGTKDAELRYGAFCYSRAYILSGNAVFSSYTRSMLVGNTREIAGDIALAFRQSFRRRLQLWSAFNSNYSFVADWNYTGTVFRIFDDASDSSTYGSESSERSAADMTDSLVQNWINGAGPLTSTSSIMPSVAIENLRFYVWMNDTVLLPYVFAFPLFDSDFSVEINYGGFGAVLARATSDYFLRIYLDDHQVEDVQLFMECIANFSAGSGGERRPDMAAVNAISVGPLFDAYHSKSYTGLGRLPGLERYMGAKLFFVAYCYTHCLGSWANVVDEADCNEVLRHVQQFARVFECAPGSPMNPTTARCELF